MAGKDDCNNIIPVKLDDEKIREIIKITVQEVIAKRAKNTRIQLNNHDKMWVPAAWWNDIAMTDRSSMPATAASVTYDPAANVITISASFPTVKVPPP